MGKLTVRCASRCGGEECGSGQNGGFTLLETLLTLAILVVLLSLSMVGAARWRDPLKITELDNAARAIYMAAENRSVLLQSSGSAAARLSSPGLTALSVTFTDGGTTGTVDAVMLSSAADMAVLDDLLPAGAVDPALRSGHFYILYDKRTCHVFEVFYAEKPFAREELDKLRGKSLFQRVSYYREDTANRCLVGHYEGGLADKIDTGSLPVPDVEIIIENGNELTLTVRYAIPPELAGMAVEREPSVTLAYGGGEIRLLYTEEFTKTVKSPYSDRLTTHEDITAVSNPMIAVYTWVLDSLAGAPGGSSRHFKDLFAGTAPALGGDFTVTAGLKLSADGCIGSCGYARAAENTLFASGSGHTDTVYIANLRHLQNLDNACSGAAKKTAAVQLADINAGTFMDNEGNKKIEKYEFIPIENWDLFSYEARRPGGTGSPYAITNLNVTAASAAGKERAGLFSGVNNNFEFKYVRLADSRVSAGNSQHAGGLAGSAPNATFIGCSIENVAVTSPSEWSWSYVGGLAGVWWGSITFDGCQARNLTVTSSGAYAGGLAGGGDVAVVKNCTVGDPESAQDSKTVTITAPVYAGGLVGSLGAGGVFDRCRAANANVISTGTDSEAGGLVGRATGAAFKNCAVKRLVAEGTGNAGGLVGGTVGAGMDTCTAENVAVTATAGYAGGLVGNSAEKDEFIRCKTVSAVVSSHGDKSIAGGLVGGATDAVFRECSVSTATVKGAANAGGLVGESVEAHLDTCTAENVSVSAASYAGGLTGNSTRGALAGCAAVNASVISSGSAGEAGGLIGRTMGTNLKGCRVYWNDAAGLKDGAGALQYQVSAETAGGLVGAMREGGLIEACFAATLVRGGIYAGGLAGNLPEPEAGKSYVSVAGSYADCLLQAGQGPEYPYAGGLVGMKSSNVTLKLENVYAAGFIEMVGDKTQTAAGLCGGFAEGTTAVNAYAAVAVYYTAPYTFQTLAFGEASFTNCHYHNYISANGSAWLAGGSKSYAEMSAAAFAGTMGSAFETPAESHPYNLDGAARDAYPFPGLSGLPHYGDWLIFGSLSGAADMAQ